MRKVARDLLQSLDEAIEFAKGGAIRDEFRVHVRIPAKVDVKSIRSKLKMTQQQFASRFGFSVNTLRHWEQGNREPEGAAKAYLVVIDRDPDAVTKALTRAS
jgi:putative transcriptional regulator